MMDIKIIQILNLIAVFSVPLITVYTFRKERIERNRPILSFDLLKDNKRSTKIKAYMSNCGIEYNDKENKIIKVSQILKLLIANIGVGIAHRIDVFYIRDNNKKTFTKLTFSLNNQYNYGINLKPDWTIELLIDSINNDKKCQDFIVCYEDVYKNKYIDIIEITNSTNNEKGSDNDKNIKYVYYNKEEYKNQEINTFEKGTIKNNKVWINNVVKIANYIKKYKNKLSFNILYTVKKRI